MEKSGKIWRPPDVLTALGKGLQSNHSSFSFPKRQDLYFLAQLVDVEREFLFHNYGPSACWFLPSEHLTGLF